MTSSEISHCMTLIQKRNKILNKYPLRKETTLKNEIFKIMSSDIDCWIMSILKAKGLFLSQEEIKSISWDCFSFALRHFREGFIPVPNHFYTYTKFSLIQWIAQINKDKKENEGEKKDDHQKDEHIDEGIAIVYDHLDELKKFRHLIGKDGGDKGNEYQKVFDDALWSMMASTKRRERRKEEIDISLIKYHESKKIFKWVIRFLLVK